MSAGPGVKEETHIRVSTVVPVVPLLPRDGECGEHASSCSGRVTADMIISCRHPSLRSKDPER